MLVKSLTFAGIDYINVPSENLIELGLSHSEINQVLMDENTKNQKVEVISLRDKLLAESDYLVMPDYPIPDKSNIETYRQALRDITQQAGYPLSVVWPVKPEL